MIVGSQNPLTFCDPYTSTTLLYDKTSSFLCSRTDLFAELVYTMKIPSMLLISDNPKSRSYKYRIISKLSRENILSPGEFIQYPRDNGETVYRSFKLHVKDKDIIDGSEYSKLIWCVCSNCMCLF